MDDRRRHARFRSATIMQYKDRIFAPSIDTMTKDISLGGLCFFSDKKLKIGRVIKIKLFYGTRAPAKVMKGKVVWSTPYEDKLARGYLNGLTFIQC